VQRLIVPPANLQHGVLTGTGPRGSDPRCAPAGLERRADLERPSARQVGDDAREPGDPRWIQVAAAGQAARQLKSGHACILLGRAAGRKPAAGGKT
jgi:hypothetical protein